MTPGLLLLAYRPLLDPLPIHGAEWAALPAIALFMAMAYRGVRTEHIDHYWPGTFRVAGVIVLVMVILSALAWLAIEIAYALAP
ncbi:MAG: hypothetical protein AAGF47_01800 [Planctomycetota bacterium]